MSHFFVVCIGRSGSKWLSNILGCPHENKDHRSKVIPQPWTPFPLHRWRESPDYGEVNGMLRYHLSAQHLGDEMMIGKRVYLCREPLDIIASWMRLGGVPNSRRTHADLSATAQEVLWHSANLDGWAKASLSLKIRSEDLWCSVTDTQDLVDHLLGPGKVKVTEEMLIPQNITPRLLKEGWGWTQERLETVQRAADRVGYVEKRFV